jgi:hypothetical protein
LIRDWDDSWVSSSALNIFWRERVIRGDIRWGEIESVIEGIVRREMCEVEAGRGKLIKGN